MMRGENKKRAVIGAAVAGVLLLLYMAVSAPPAGSASAAKSSKRVMADEGPYVKRTMREDKPPPHPEEMFTLVVASYKRNDVLKITLEHYCNMPELDRILLVWNNLDHEALPPPRPEFFNCEAPIVVLPQEANEVENRLLQAHLIRTPCVFQVDDDLYIPTEDLRLGLRMWRAYPNRLIGYTPRIHVQTSEGWKYRTHIDNEYSMVIGSAIILDKRYYEAYAKPSKLTDTLRAYVREQSCCDDIALNALASSISGEPPLYVFSEGTHELKTQTEGGWRGKSKQRGWNAKRSAAVDYYMSVFGKDPFKKSDIVVRRLEPKEQSSWFSWLW